MLQDYVKLPLFVGVVPLMLSPQFCSKDSVVGHDLIVQDEALCAQPYDNYCYFSRNPNEPFTSSQFDDIFDCGRTCRLPSCWSVVWIRQ